MEPGNWYWLEKAIIREYAPKVGPLGIAVYNYLASLVDSEQMCFPSQRRIGEVLGYSRTSINRAIKRLEYHGLLSVQRSGRCTQTYQLLEISCKPDARKK
jgi:biotin operon repressor